MRHLLIEKETGNNFSMGSLTAFERVKHKANRAKHALQVGVKCVNNHMQGLSGWDKASPANINPHMQGH